jgi:hypothetical protein
VVVGTPPRLRLEAGVTVETSTTAIERIHSARELAALAHTLGVRRDWHEPDEQEVDVELVGLTHQLDNAMGADAKGEFEPNVVIWQGERPMAVVNLADLLAWASRYGEHPRGRG